MDQSSIKLLSNIMLKSRVTKAKDGSISYLPFDLMPGEYGDVRNDQFLSDYQRTQKLKAMFAAKRIVDDNSEENNADEEGAVSQNDSVSCESIKGVPSNNRKEDADTVELAETIIPEDLLENTMDIMVRGVYNGWFYLVPYDGSVKDCTDKQTETMHLLVMRKGRQKRVPVSVVREDSIMYIRGELLALYEKEFGNPNGVELICPLRE